MPHRMITSQTPIAQNNINLTTLNNIVVNNNHNTNVNVVNQLLLTSILANGNIINSVPPSVNAHRPQFQAINGLQQTRMNPQYIGCHHQNSRVSQNRWSPMQIVPNFNIRIQPNVNGTVSLRIQPIMTRSQSVPFLPPSFQVVRNNNPFSN